PIALVSAAMNPKTNSKTNPPQPKPDSNPKPDSQEPNKNDDERRKQVQRQMNYGITYLIASLIGLWLFQQFVLNPLALQSTEIPYSDFKIKLAAGQIVDLTIGDTQIVGDMKNPVAASGDTTSTVPFSTVAVPNGDPKLIDELDAAGVKYSVAQPPS